MWPSVLQIIYLLRMQTTKHFILLKSDVCKVMRRRKVTHVALQVGMQEAQTKVQQISPRYHDGDDRICALQIGKWFRGDCGNCPPSKQTSCFGFIHTSILMVVFLVWSIDHGLNNYSRSKRYSCYLGRVSQFQNKAWSNFYNLHLFDTQLTWLFCAKNLWFQIKKILQIWLVGKKRFA